MKSLLLCLFFIPAAAGAFCSTKVDSILLKNVKVMFKEDQKWRREANNLRNGKGSAYDDATIEGNMGKADSLNMIEAKAIIAKYGYPGYNLIGEDGSSAFWAIVQHCDDDLPFQQKVMALMAKEVKQHNASGENYALLQDRILTSQGRKQIYGTQVRIDQKTHHAQPFPIKDSLHVDLRRKAVGLPPLKDYLQSFNPK